MAGQKSTDDAPVYLDDPAALAWIRAHGLKVGPRYALSPGEKGQRRTRRPRRLEGS